MSQIKRTQIIPGKELQRNPSSPLPIDLDPLQRYLITDPITTVQDPATDSTIGDSGSEAPSPDSTLQIEDPTPNTPAIISVKEQIVKFMPDGTAKVDIILEVQDIEGAVEYDIRVAKGDDDL